MATLTMYNTSGQEAGTIELNDSVFAKEYNEALIHQVVVAQLANKRQGTQSALTRGEVRGGGIKPWKQKGTGRARQGSIRAPQWVGGGMVHAVKPRDYTQKINKNAKREALKSALSAKVSAGEFKVLNELKLQAAKTKEMVAVLNALKLTDSTLLVLAEADATVLRAAANIENLKTINAELINVYDLVASKNCLITAAAVKKIEEAQA